MISLCCGNQRLLKCVWGLHIIPASEQLQVTSSLRHYWFLLLKVFSVQGQDRERPFPRQYFSLFNPVFREILPIC